VQCPVERRAANLRQVAAVDIHRCDALAFNRELVWVLRVIALDLADGLIPKNEEIEYHASDLYGLYNRLARIFPQLESYRRMEAHDRFQSPSIEAEQAIRLVCHSFGNPEIGGSVLSPGLSRELMRAGEEIDLAKRLTETESAGETLEVSVESHADVATRSLAVWGWLSNASERLVKAGKRADDVATAVERYEKVYETLSPHMGRYIEYLLKWFF
jgi:hypothetical protein